MIKGVKMDYYFTKFSFILILVIMNDVSNIKSKLNILMMMKKVNQV